MIESGTTHFSLSPAQEYLWQQAPQCRTTQLSVMVDGSLDPDRLEAALRTIVDRHEILRTSFPILESMSLPVQSIAASATFGWQDAGDLAEQSSDEQAQAIAALRSAEQLAIDLHTGPTFRAALLRVATERHLLVLTAATLCADLRSLELLVQELARFYSADQTIYADEVLQYADFSAWHRDLLHASDSQARRAFWEDQVDAAVVSAARTIEHHLAEPEYVYGAVRAQVAAALAERLNSWSASQGYAPSVVLQTAWYALLWRLCGEQDLLVGLTSSGRSYAELETAIGRFACDLPIACRFPADLLFDTAVKQIQAANAAVVEHQEYFNPQMLDVGASSNGLPLSFEYRTLPPASAAGSLHFTPVESGSSSPTTLKLICTQQADGYNLLLQYDARHIGAVEAERWLDYYQTLLEQAMQTPTAPLTQLGLIGEDEYRRLLDTGRPAPSDYPSQRCFHQLFAEQAARTPAAVAVICGEATLTYAELDARANQLAHALRRRDVRPGVRVAVCLPRSIDLLVGLLGVLKAGGAYVPLDPAYPQERLALLLDDAQARLLLTHTTLSQLVPSNSYDLLYLDGDWPAISVEPDAPVSDESAPDQLAYVIYTSGTTGKPNGVMIHQRGLVNYLTWAQQTYRLSEGGGSLVHSSIAFDLTITGLFGPLLVGHRVILLPDEYGIAALAKALRTEHDFSLVKLTPTHLQVLSELLTPAQIAGHVRTLVVGGEDLQAQALALFRETENPPRIFNEYGPTETVVGSICYEVTASTPTQGKVPIGTPIANTTVYLLDAQLRPVADGVPGEIFIGGAGVAQGYLNRPELTEAKFVRDPFAANPADARLYRTGDLARRLPDGNLEFLHRRDDQIKVRGVRIEPAEIEAVLLQNPAIQAAVVIARSDEPQRSSPLLKDERQLIAYVVPATGQEVVTQDIMQRCQQALPEHLRPAAIVVLDHLPVTPNGKLDRRALPRPDTQAIPRQQPFASPQTPTEEILVGAIASVLGLEDVSIDDNYFTLGGDSIRSVMVTSRAKARGVVVTVADLHRYPTVRQLAAMLDSPTRPELAAPQTAPFSLISREDREKMPPDVEDAFPLNLLQEGMIFHRDFAPKSAVYHAIASLRIRAPLDVQVMRTVLHQLVERHPMLRTSFDQANFSQPLQLVHRTFKEPFSFQDLRHLSAEEREQEVVGWVEHEKQRGFELDEYPLIRFMVQQLTEDTFQFTYGFHHEIVDGWSEALMITEIFTHYFAVMFEQPLTLKPPTSTMRDAVALEQQALQQKDNLEFWTRYLEDATLMRLPRLFSSTKADKGERKIVRLAVPISRETSDGLKKLARAHAVPLKSVLLAAHMMVMCRYGGHSDTLTYTVTNGRPEHADGSGAIGLFVNSLALRVNLNGGTWSDLILQTLASEQASLPYRRLPMAELKRHQGNEPLAETLFFFTDYHVFNVLERWAGVEHINSILYGESTFPFCAIFRLNRVTADLEVRIEYDSLQFAGELMERISDCYVQVLDTLLADPSAHYETALLLAPSEREQILSNWNTTNVPIDTEQCIHQLFEAQAQRQPDAIALQYETQSLSYDELNRRANQLARHLRSLGVGPETRVGICATRTPDMIVAMLGTLKAGGAYVPLDPAYPQERLAKILADAHAQVLLVQPQLVELLPEHEARVVLLDTAQPYIDQAPAHNLEITTTADNLAYVIYTSGSTGQPKGVAVPHSSLVNSTVARFHYYETPATRFLLLPSFAFDSSVAPIFWTLCQGGTLVLPAEGLQLDPVALSQQIEAQQITHMLSVPSLYAPVLEAAADQQLTSLQCVIVAGESCPKELWQAHQRKLPQVRFYNEYGPTEATVWSTVWQGEPIAWRTHLPIGRPIANTEVYLLNEHLQPAPIGVPGELHVGGANLVRGYLDRPDLTAERFIPNPFSTEPGARLYKTGDLARYLPDGTIEFLDRIDHQIKIRGFRVELGEIEAVLDSHVDIQRSVLLVREDTPGDKSLVSYVTLAPGAVITTSEVQQFVREKLPKYMVPATIVVLDQMPLTPTGKIDRAALPQPEQTRPTLSNVFVAPETTTEELLSGIWCQVLGLQQVGVNDDFFDLGGESLRAMQVTTKLNKAFDIQLSVRTLFDLPTVRQLAQTIDRVRWHTPQETAGSYDQGVL